MYISYLITSQFEAYNKDLGTMYDRTPFVLIKDFPILINKIAVSFDAIPYLSKYLLSFSSNSLPLTYGGFPITTSNPPSANTCGNSASQLNALSPATSGSSISEFPHLILSLRSFNFLCGRAVRNHRESLAISTLSSFKSTPKRLFSKY